MASNDVRIKVSLDGDQEVISGLDGIGDSADKSDSKFKSLIKGGLAGTGQALLGLGVAATAMGAAMSVAVVKSYADYEQNLGGIETMFGAGGKSAEEYAESVGKSVEETAAEYVKLMDSQARMIEYADQAYINAGLSANEYMSQVTGFSASLLQGLGGDTLTAAEIANKAMVDMSDNANKFGSDISAIQTAYAGFSKQNFTMLDNLKLGYGGTATEMQRLLSDAEALEGAMGRKFDLNNFADIVEAIHLIQEEMGVAGTTSLEASETISGSIGMLKGSFENLLTGLGDADADVATLAGNVIGSLELVVSNIAPVIGNIGAHLETLGPELGGMVEGLVGVLAEALPGVISAGASMIGGLIQGIGSALPGLVKAAVPIVVDLVKMLATQLPLLVSAGVEAIQALGDGIVEALPVLMPAVVELVTGVVTGLIDALPILLTVAIDLVMALADGILAALPVLIAALPSIINGIVGFLVGAIPTLSNAGVRLLLSLVSALPEIIKGIVAAIPVIIEGLVSALTGSIPELITAGIDLLMGLIGALPEIVVSLVEAIPVIITALVRGFTGAIPQLVQGGVQLFMGLIQNLPQIVIGIAGAIPEILGGILGAVSGGVSQMASAGWDLLRGLWDGISNAAGWLWGKVTGWMDGLLGGIKDFFGISSPSRVLRDQVGAQLPAGLGEGVTDNAKAAIDPLRDLNRAILDQASELPELTMRAIVQEPTLTPPPMYAATPLSSPLLSMLDALNPGGSTDDLLARIDPRDMDALATKVYDALVRVRSADGRDATMDLRTGVR